MSDKTFQYEYEGITLTVSGDYSEVESDTSWPASFTVKRVFIHSGAKQLADRGIRRINVLTLIDDRIVSILESKGRAIFSTLQRR